MINRLLNEPYFSSPLSINWHPTSTKYYYCMNLDNLASRVSFLSKSQDQDFHALKFGGMIIKDDAHLNRYLDSVILGFEKSLLRQIGYKDGIIDFTLSTQKLVSELKLYTYWSNRDLNKLIRLYYLVECGETLQKATMICFN